MLVALLAVWAVWAVVAGAQKEWAQVKGDEMCVEVVEAALWDTADPKATAVPSTLSPALRGDRVRVAELKGSLARVSAESFFPRFVWIAKEALAPCADAEGSKSFLAAEVARARTLVRELKGKVVACEESGAEACEEEQQRLLSAMDDLKRLCDADPDCKAARKTTTK